MTEDGRGYSAYFTGGEAPFVEGLQSGATANATIDNWNVLGIPYLSPVAFTSVIFENAAVSSLVQFIPSGPWAGTYAP